MRWIIRLAIFGAVIATEQLIINAWVAHAVSRYQHTFWGRAPTQHGQRRQETP